MTERAVSAILLAAGESLRMGAVNKLTIELGGLPLLRRTALTLLKSSLSEIVVVLGHDEATARSMLDGLPLRQVYNPHYREGQMTSVHRGMQSLREPCEGVMVCLADQALLEPADIDAMVLAFLDDCPRSVLVPTYQGRRGNPIILAHRHRAALLAGDRNLGCKRLIENNPDLVWPFPMDNDHCVVDLDNASDYERVAARFSVSAAGLCS